MVELGLRAEALLGSSTFKFVVDHLAESYANNILLSSASEAGVREENYHLHQALQHIVSQLGAFGAAARAIVEESEQEEQD